MLKGDTYKTSLSWEDNEVTFAVTTSKSGRERPHIVLKGRSTMPEYCAYCGKDGFTCYHAAAALMDKYGESRLWECVEKRHHTTTWKEQYEGVEM